MRRPNALTISVYQVVSDRCSRSVIKSTALEFATPFVFSEGQNSQQTAPPPGTQGGKVKCPPWTFHSTFVGAHQARDKGAFSGKLPQVGDVAIDPRDFGYDDYYDLASKIENKPYNQMSKESQDAFNKISQEQKEIKNAHITITPTSPMPKGTPSNGPYNGVDAIHPDQPGTVDVYRTTMAQARKLDGLK